MVKRLYLLLTAQDQEVLSGALTQAIPALAFVNGTVWETDSPPLVPSIAAATTRRVLLWDRSLVPALPTLVDVHGKIHGPSTRDVISFDRPQIEQNHQGMSVLVSGLLFWSSDDPPPGHAAFYRSVWRVARKVAHYKVVAAEGGIADGFLAGPDAVNWWVNESASRRFGLNAVGITATPLLEK